MHFAEHPLESETILALLLNKKSEDLLVPNHPLRSSTYQGLTLSQLVPQMKP